MRNKGWKRLLVLLFTWLVGFSVYSADVIYGWEGDTEAELKIKYEVISSDIKDSEVGFSTTRVWSSDTSNLEKSSGELVLTEDNNLINKEDIYLYWVIGYGLPYKISLMPSGPLTSEKDYIDWQISWKSPIDNREEKLGGAIGYSGGDVYVRNDIHLDYDIGAVELNIVTENIGNKAAGDYSGNLQLRFIPL